MMDKAILCVDDEETVLRSLKEQIYDYFGEQYLCEVAESAEEAWEVIEEFNKQKICLVVIVSDWLMPGMKGDEFLMAVHKKFPKVIKVILSGQVDEFTLERAKGILDGYFRKPWRAEELIKTIREKLE